MLKLQNTALTTIKDNFIDTEYLIDTRETATDMFYDYTLSRVNNDVYGNPLYKLNLTSGDFIHSSVAHRNYMGKGYYLLQSYDIKTDLDRLFQDLGMKVQEVLEVER